MNDCNKKKIPIFENCRLRSHGFFQSQLLIRIHHFLHAHDESVLSQGHVAQSVTYQTADPGVENSIPAMSHTFVEIDHEIISMAILLPYVYADSRRVVVSYK